MLRYPDLESPTCDIFHTCTLIMTTLQPRKPYTEDELRTLYPSGLELQQVQVLLRHGERTPVSPRFQNAGLSAFWPYCSALRHMRDAVLERAEDGKPPAFATLEWKRRLETFGPNDTPVIATGPGGELDGVCDMGMSTERLLPSARVDAVH